MTGRFCCSGKGGNPLRGAPRARASENDVRGGAEGAPQGRDRDRQFPAGAVEAEARAAAGH